MDVIVWCKCNIMKCHYRWSIKNIYIGISTEKFGSKAEPYKATVVIV